MNLVPNNVIQRVLHIAVGDVTATGTVIDHDDRQYIVTARHFAELLDGEIEISRGGGWLKTDVTCVGHALDADISVLALPHLIVHPDLTVTNSMAGLMYGGDVYFLGFPFGFSADVGNYLSGFPLPFIKRAIVSSMGGVMEGVDCWLDGINNVGFSGGPVVWGNSESPNEYKVIGIISAYYVNREDVVSTDTTIKLTTNVNSGLIMVVGIYRALDLICKNPCGPSLTSFRSDVTEK